MTKRQQFITISFLLSLGLLGVNSLEIDFRPLAGLGLSFLGTFLTYLALRRSLDGLEFLTLLLPPFLLTLGFSLTFFFFPNFNVFFELVILGAFFFSFYSCLLSENIFSAAAAKNLLLLKPAQTTFIFVVLSIFFLIVTYIFKSGLYVVFQNLLILLLAAVISFIVFWTQALNKVLRLEHKIIWRYSGLATLGLFAATWPLNFLPLEPFFRSLVITAAYNAILGILIAKSMRQISSKIIIEYLMIPFFALIFSLTAG